MLYDKDSPWDGLDWFVMVLIEIIIIVVLYQNNFKTLAFIIAIFVAIIESYNIMVNLGCVPTQLIF